MSGNGDIQAKVLSFLAGEFSRKEGRQCVQVDLLFAPGNGFRDEEIRKWVRADEPEMFDNFVNVEKLAALIAEIAEGEADAKPAGKHRFVVRTHQHMGGRATSSFALSPGFHGGDDAALVPGGARGGGGGGGGDAAMSLLLNHSGQLMRTNSSMFEGTIRVLGQQTQDLRQENSELRAENILLRREVDEARSNKVDREFQIAMAAEKNARTNAGFQKLLQIGSVMAAKIGGAETGASGEPSPLAQLVLDFGKSIRPDQMGSLMGILDIGQKIIFMELMNLVLPPEQKPDETK